jgi:hypothetical protein
MKVLSALAVLLACFCVAALSCVVVARKLSPFHPPVTELQQRDRSLEPVSWAISYDARTGRFRCTRHPRLKLGAERNQHHENQDW